ncbi:stalk domain-containing protein [Dehalobacterium formicoaceticum]|uniref:Stalk domain-containing protein n=1 Tax=Dehalobacterium formicoaceticum TaxID=51515 RepID=A0ABT1Y5N4_9FIRM|nr:stalk domain-containing protein [Dehalobacterium formicoaceticum]MCR6545791.1 stalk domain-containing protein [Dehalobacterium formicoaceticum]
MPKLKRKRCLKSKLMFSMILLCLCAFLTSHAAAAAAVKPIAEETITRGAVLQQYTVKTASGTSKVFVTKINIQDPYIKMDVIYGIDGKLGKNQNVANMAQENKAIAAINGDFFDMTTGSLFGPIMKDEKWITTPTTTIDGLSGFAMTDGGQPRILPFSFQGSLIADNGASFPVAAVNKTFSCVDKINIFTNDWDVSALPGEALGTYVYVLVQDDEVSEILFNEKPKRISRDDYVILGHGLGANFLVNNLYAGAEVEFDFSVDQGDDWQFVMGAHTPLVANGKRAQFTRDIPGSRARSAVGISQDQKYVYWIGVEKSGTSTGMTLTELADFMVQLGVAQGVNLDGGGSTTVLSRSPGDFTPSLKNQPEQGNLRNVPNGLALYSTAPQGTLKDFVIGGPSFLLMKEKAELSLKAIDEYDNPLNMQDSNMTWQSKNDKAAVQGNQLQGQKVGTAIVEAHSNQINQQFNVEIIGRDGIQEMGFNTDSLLLNPGQTVTLKPVITTKNGARREVDASLFNWEWINVDGEKTGPAEFKAGMTPGSGWLVGTYDRFSKMVPVSIGTTSQVIMDFENQPQIGFLGTPAEVTGQFVLNNTEKKAGQASGSLSYDFAKASADVQAAYGQFGTQGLPFSGTANGLNLWVYGDNNNYWLRAEIVNQKGETSYLTLADKVNWSGWQEVSVDFPQAMENPILKRVYVVNLKNSTGHQSTDGTILFDQISYKTTAPSATKVQDTKLKLFVNQKRMLVNDREQQIDQGPILENGRSYIPARFIIEALGGRVYWTADEKKVRILFPQNMIDLWVNDKEHTIVNGKNQPADTAPIIRNSRTLIPVRMVTENLGYQVDWIKGEITIAKK